MAHALKFRALVSGKTLRLPDLSAFEGKQVEVIVVEDDAPRQATPPAAGERVFGSMAGQFVVPENFNDPLPEELLSAFEGRTEV